MRFDTPRHICWTPTWNTDHPGVGMEHVVLSGRTADGLLLGLDEDVPFRLQYQLQWDASGRLRRAVLHGQAGLQTRSLQLDVDDDGRWRDGASDRLHHLDGCVDIDIWPTPLTNSFPIWRSHLSIGERREFRMAWVSAPALTVEAKAQAYTRLADRLYLFESLDGSAFKAQLAVDGDGIVVDYPALFRRVSLPTRLDPPLPEHRPP